jgi:putative membrane protein
MWKKLAGVALMATVMVAGACDDDDDGDNRDLSQQDKNFITMASYGNRAEVELGALAASKGNSDAVRMYGNMMVDEHEDALDDLEDIADDFDADFPTGLDAEHQEKKEMLMALSGYSFDTAYMHSQVVDHEKTEALFETEVASGKEQRLKDYANNLLPHIRMHLHKADSILTVLEDDNGD